MSELLFDDQGRGPAVVLLPPFPFDRRIWAANVPALVGAGRRVIAIDYPGFGASPPLAVASDGPPPLTIDAIADGVAATLDRLQLSRVALVGVSMGGYVAIAFAARFGDRLDALALGDTRATADGPAALEGRRRALDTLHTRGVDAYLAESLPRLLAPDASAAALAMAYLLGERRAETLAAGIAALRDRPDRAPALGGIACPTLVLCGAADQVTPPAEMRAMAAAITGARFVELAGAGHLANLETPAAFDRALGDFLNAAAPAGGSAPPSPVARGGRP